MGEGVAGHEERQARGVGPTGEGVEPAPQHLPVCWEQSSELDVGSRTPLPEQDSHVQGQRKHRGRASAGPG